MRARLPLLVVLVALVGQLGLGWLACDRVDGEPQAATAAVTVACPDAGGGAPGNPCEHHPTGMDRYLSAPARTLDVPPVSRVSVVREVTPARADAPPVPAAVREPVAVLGVDRN